MRLLPVAITPISFRDIGRSILGSFRSDGRATFEAEVGARLGLKGGYSFNSLMRTTYACLQAVGQVDTRRRVVLSRYSCPSFMHGITAAGFEVEYVDIDSETLSISLEGFRELDLSRVAAVLCANLFGLYYPMDEICTISREHGIQIIEGVDYAFGGTYRGYPMGSYGDYAILNFQEGKGIPVGGGMVVTNHVKAMEKALSTGARRSAVPNLHVMLGYRVFSVPQLYSLFRKASSLLNTNLQKSFSMEDTIRKTTGESDFVFDRRNALRSISNFQGALGQIVLRRMDDDMARRAENATLLEEGLADCPWIQLIRREEGVERTHYIRYPILISGGRRQAAIDELLRRGVEASPMYVDHGITIDGEAFPGANRVMNELLTIPCHPKVTPQDVRTIIEVLYAI